MYVTHCSGTEQNVAAMKLRGLRHLRKQPGIGSSLLIVLVELKTKICQQPFPSRHKSLILVKTVVHLKAVCIMIRPTT